MADRADPWMHLGRFLLAVFFVVATLRTSLADTVSHGQTLEARQLFVYTFYKDVQIFHYRVPGEVLVANWTFFANESQGCSPKNVSLHLQYGSYPVISPDNTTFPPNFYIHRSFLYNLTILSDSRPYNLRITEPLPGDWFVIAFLRERNDRIQQKGLFTKCSTWLASSLSFRTATNLIQLLPGVALSQQITASQYYKFFVPSNTWSVTVTVKQCTSIPTATEVECPLTLLARPLAIPSLSATSQSFSSSSSLPELSVNCSSNYTRGLCVLHFVPYEEAWHYLLLHLGGTKVEFQITVEAAACENGATPTQYLILSELKFSNASTIGAKTLPPGGLRVPNAAKRILVPLPFTGRTKANNNNSSAPACWPQVALVRKTFPGNFLFEYVREAADNGSAVSPSPPSSSASPTKLDLNNTVPTLLAFPLQPVLDIGGTLTLELGIDISVNTTMHNISVTACLAKGTRPVASLASAANCSVGVGIQVNTSSDAGRASLVMVPYPEPGTWYVTLQATCYRWDATSQGSVNKIPCESNTTAVVFNVMSGSCVYGGCGPYGRCYQYMSGGFIFSTCVCTAGWRGWGCTDGSFASSDFELLLATLLLTLSNLLFLPTVALAIYRHYYTEAFVYFFTMFFSTFYHACDEEAYTFCLMRLSVMQFCDFYSAILSFWVTIIAMADLPAPFTSLAHMAGALGIATGVEYDRTGLWVFVVPSATGVLILLVSWVCHCYKGRTCFPKKRIWLCLVPGVLLVGTGLICFAFLETRDNYKYVHSSWHAAMALAVIFLLPPRRKNKEDSVIEHSGNSCCDWLNNCSCACKPAWQSVADFWYGIWPRITRCCSRAFGRASGSRRRSARGVGRELETSGFIQVLAR